MIACHTLIATILRDVIVKWEFGSRYEEIKKNKKKKNKERKEEKGENKGWRKIERKGRGNFDLELRL